MPLKQEKLLNVKRLNMRAGNDTLNINGVPVYDLAVGPVRNEPDSYEGGVVARMKVCGLKCVLPNKVGLAVDIEGERWEVEDSTVVFKMAVVTYKRFLG